MVKPVIAAAALTGLLVAVPAAGKGPVSLRISGADVRGEFVVPAETLRAFRSPWWSDSPAHEPSDRRAPVYRMALELRAEGRSEPIRLQAWTYYAPREGRPAVAYLDARGSSAGRWRTPTAEFERFLQSQIAPNIRESAPASSAQVLAGGSDRRTLPVAIAAVLMAAAALAALVVRRSQAYGPW